MLDFAVRLTTLAYKMTPEDVGRLRGVGFDDAGILQITLIAAWFNYINRVADALGVGKPAPDVDGQRPSLPGPSVTSLNHDG